MPTKKSRFTFDKLHKSPLLILVRILILIRQVVLIRIREPLLRRCYKHTLISFLPLYSASRGTHLGTPEAHRPPDHPPPPPRPKLQYRVARAYEAADPARPASPRLAPFSPSTRTTYLLLLLLLLRTSCNHPQSASLPDSQRTTHPPPPPTPLQRPFRSSPLSLSPSPAAPPLLSQPLLPQYQVPPSSVSAEEKGRTLLVIFLVLFVRVFLP